MPTVKKVYIVVFLIFLLISLLLYSLSVMIVTLPKSSYITEQFEGTFGESLALMVNKTIHGKEHPKTLKNSPTDNS